MRRLAVFIPTSLLVVVFIGRICPVFGRSGPVHGIDLVDTIPPAVKPAGKQQEVPENKTVPLPEAKTVPLPDIIKEVPKSRRKIKPIAVPAPMPVKPIRIIRPGVIRKTIRVIG
jgi:hypothetical protein